MKRGECEVLVLDGSQAIRRNLENLIRGLGHRVRLYPTPDEMFRGGLPALPCCLIVGHQRGKGLNGFEVQAELERRGWDVPTIFVAAHWNVQLVVEAIRAGADGFLTKPYESEALVEAVTQALHRSRTQRQRGLQAAAAVARVATLTTREREVLSHVVAGKLNRQIADELQIALVTVKVHRGRAMRKLGAGNSAQLAHIAALAGMAI